MKAGHQIAAIRVTAQEQFSDPISVPEGHRVHFSLQELRAAVSAIVGTDGERYEVGDKVTLIGGEVAGGAAIFNVDSIGSTGEIITVSLDSSGFYTIIPINDAVVSPTPPAGSPAALTVTYGDVFAGTGVLQIRFRKEAPWRTWLEVTAPTEDSSLILTRSAEIRVGLLAFTTGLALIEARVSGNRATA